MPIALKVVLIIASLLLIQAAFFVLVKRRRTAASTPAGVPSFFGKSPLTDVEQVLYHRLRDALPDSFVLAQIQVSQIVGVHQGPLWQTWFNKISRKSVDFLICRHDFSIVAAIELDESSHDHEQRRLADADKNTALNGAGIKVIRWRVKSLPSVELIRAAFHESDDPSALG